MKRLKKIKKVGFIGIMGAAMLEIMGIVFHKTSFSVLALVILWCVIVLYLFLYKCPNCGKFLGGRYGDHINREDGIWHCPFCNKRIE